MNALQQAMMKAKLVTEKDISKAVKRCKSCDAVMIKKDSKSICPNNCN